MGKGGGRGRRKKLKLGRGGGRRRGDAGIISRESAPLSFPIVSPIFQFE